MVNGIKIKLHYGVKKIFTMSDLCIGKSLSKFNPGHLCISGLCCHGGASHRIVFEGNQSRGNKERVAHSCDSANLAPS